MTSIRFKVWGCRGGRNTCGSSLGNATSCYSLAVDDELFVFDAGRGLVALAEEVVDGGALAAARRLHLVITHAHMDHWEGLKDARWMWRRNNGIALHVLAPREALDAIRQGHQPPAFVALEVLALGTLASLQFTELHPGSKVALPGATLEPVALHHYSGIAPNQRHLDTLGCRLAIDTGPAVAYLCDHEPTPQTRAMESAVLAASQLALVDASYARVADHAFGHGSIEYAAELARVHPSTRVLATHLGPDLSDREIEDAHRHFGATTPNLAIAVEGCEEHWDPAARRFARVG